MAEFLAVSLFALGYLAITLEHRLFVNKAATGMLLAVGLWVIVGLTMPAGLLAESLKETGADIFSLIIFLMTSMTLVEILVHYHTFDLMEHWLRKYKLNLYQIGWAIAGLSFFLSSFIANLTVTIVAIQIAKRFFPEKYFLPMAALVVITSNAGGAFSPIGDVTTLMMWFAKLFTADQVVFQAFLPSLALAIIATYLILRKISNTDRAIIWATFATFLLPLLASALRLPPYMGLLAGLGLVWILIDVAKKARPQQTHLQARISRFMQQTDIESIQFFLGILLSVSALHALGVLELATNALLGTAPSFARIVGAFAGMGIGSAIVDNVPITAAAISALHGITAPLWVYLAIAVGTGGSILVIGSASGIIAMGMLPKLTFGKYLTIGTIPALLGFAGATVVWLVQYWLFFT